MIEYTRVGSAGLPVARRLRRTSWPRAALREIQQIVRARFVLEMLTTTQLALRYHRSVLGFAWTFVNPLLLLAVQTAVFSQILKIDARTYAVYLFSGLVPWQFFSTALQSTSQSLIANEGLLRRVAVPIIVFPLSDLLVAAVNMGFGMLALLVAIVAIGPAFQPQMVLLLPATVLLMALTAGIALFTMSVTTFYRDVTPMIAIALFALYFITPIIYPPSAVHSPLLRFNPLTYYIEFFHDALLPAAALRPAPAVSGGLWPPPLTWAITTLCSVASLCLGYAAFKVNEDEFIFRL